VGYILWDISYRVLVHMNLLTKQPILNTVSAE
jgi:hypothetical protein